MRYQLDTLTSMRNYSGSHWLNIARDYSSLTWWSDPGVVVTFHQWLSPSCFLSVAPKSPWSPHWACRAEHMEVCGSFQGLGPGMAVGMYVCISLARTQSLGSTLQSSCGTGCKSKMICWTHSIVSITASRMGSFPHFLSNWIVTSYTWLQRQRSRGQIRLPYPIFHEVLSLLWYLHLVLLFFSILGLSSSLWEFFQLPLTWSTVLLHLF